jgi:hypothetical protein
MTIETTMTIQQRIEQLNVGSERQIEGVTVMRLSRRLYQVDGGATYARPSTAAIAVAEAVQR